MNQTAIKRHFRQVDPQIYSVMQQVNIDDWIKPRSKNKYFTSLCGEIIAQQLASSAAHAIRSRFLNLFPRKKVAPVTIMSYSDQELRDTGLSWAKVKYIKDLAQKNLDKTVRFNSLHTLQDEEVILELTKIKGVGRWTAEMFLIFSLGREDIFSFGDLGLKRGLEKLYQISDPDKERMERIVTPWSPYKSYGSLALWHSLES